MPLKTVGGWIDMWRVYNYMVDGPHTKVSSFATI